MNQKLNNTFDILGKCLLLWFMYETYVFIIHFRLHTIIEQTPILFEYGQFLMAIFLILQAIVSIFGSPLAAFLLFKGNVWGLITGIIYWAIGGMLNPLWFAVPQDLQVSQAGEATKLLWAINIVWSFSVLVVLVCFYCSRRSIIKQHIKNT